MSVGREELHISLGAVMLAAMAQAARAVVTGLIPITLLALFAWASAGSGSGDTGDALRGATILWLASHHVSMELTIAMTASAGLYSLLPIGLLVVPIFTLRGAGLRLARDVQGAKLEMLVSAVVMLAFSYALLVTGVAFIADTASVRPRFIEAFGYGGVLALLAGGSRIIRISPPERWKRVLGVLAVLGISLLVPATFLVIASLVDNLDAVSDILAVLRLGVLSTIFVVLIATLYLPNLAIWSLAYLSGIGFGFGSGTMITPWESTLGSVPAFPLLAALPAEPPRWAPLMPVYVLLVMTVVTAIAYARTEHFVRDGLRLIAAVVSIGLVLAWFSGGSLVGGALSAVGPSLWKFPLALGAHLMVGYLLGAGVPMLVRRRRVRDQRASR